MTRYIVRRLAFALFLIVAVSSASLLLAGAVPGDFAGATLGLEGGRDRLEQARERYGLNKPLAVQYRDWIVHALRLDFGNSLLYDRPVSDLIPERAVNTAILALTALTLATVVGLPLGVVVGSRRGGFVSSVIRALSVVLLSMPPLLTSLFLVFVAARTGWLPIAGMRSAVAHIPGALRRQRHP